MTRLAELQAQIGTMGELLDIFGAMRSLAGMRLVEAQHALPGVQSYAGAMTDAITAILPLLPARTAGRQERSGGRALVLLVSEHGFVGGYNERLIAAASEAAAAGAVYFLLGSRGAALMQERGWTPCWTAAQASRSAGVPETVRSLAAELYRRIERGEVATIDILSAHYCPAGTASIALRRLFPLDLSTVPRPSRQPPLTSMAPGLLFERLMADYVFALLAEAAIDAIASENAARFTAMESAHENVARKLDELRHTARQIRQDNITIELLDVVTGAEALTEFASEFE